MPVSKRNPKPYTGRLQQQGFIQVLEVLDKGLAGTGFRDELSSWLADSCLLSMPSPEQRVGRSQLLCLFLVF